MDRNSVLNDPETAMRYALSGLQGQMWTAVPCIVQSVDLAAGTITCVPAIKGVQTSDEQAQSFVQMPVLLDVPLVFPSAGGFTLSLPVTAGDEVLVVFSSRCIDAWWQSGGVQAPMELRMHDLSDGFAIPGPKSQPNVQAGLNATNARLTVDDGSAYIELTKSGAVNILAPGGLNVTGPINSTLEITAQTETTPIPLSTHLHGGVTPGSGETGVPIP